MFDSKNNQVHGSSSQSLNLLTPASIRKTERMFEIIESTRNKEKMLQEADYKVIKKFSMDNEDMVSPLKNNMMI